MLFGGRQAETAEWQPLLAYPCDRYGRIRRHALHRDTAGRGEARNGRRALREGASGELPPFQLARSVAGRSSSRGRRGRRTRPSRKRAHDPQERTGAMRAQQQPTHHALFLTPNHPLRQEPSKAQRGLWQLPRRTSFKDVSSYRGGDEEGPASSPTAKAVPCDEVTQIELSAAPIANATIPALAQISRCPPANRSGERGEGCRSAPGAYRVRQPRRTRTSRDPSCPRR